jgi:hypothetical protein
MKRSRNWILTNNYKDREPLTDVELSEIIQNMSGITYFAFQLEKGDKGTKHHQIYLNFKDAKSFNTIKQYFPNAHIESMRGTPQQASDYCTKEMSRLGDVVIWGEMPIQGKRTDLEEIYELIKNGASNKEIREQYPGQYIRYQDRFQQLRQEMLEEEYKDVFRKLEVIYLFDKPGVGKSRFIMDKYGYNNVYRISNYKNPFDQYSGQKVVVFEEFRSSLPIDSMLNWLDGYPIRLPARYSDRVACYTIVYVVSNWEYHKQYYNVQQDHPETFKALTRRFTKIGNLEEIKEYFKNKKEEGTTNETESSD